MGNKLGKKRAAAFARVNRDTKYSVDDAIKLVSPQTAAPGTVIDPSPSSGRYTKVGMEKTRNIPATRIQTIWMFVVTNGSAIRSPSAEPA